jgi:DNA-directed RNA polymerase specialized sigma24 family protein
LRLSAGLKFEVIAELLKIPLGTALSRMHAAVERLRTELGQTHEQ